MVITKMNPEMVEVNNFGKTFLHSSFNKDILNLSNFFSVENGDPLSSSGYNLAACFPFQVVLFAFITDTIL